MPENLPNKINALCLLGGGSKAHRAGLTRQKLPLFAQALTNLPYLCGKKGFVNHTRSIFTATYGVVRP
ncbi:MAG: hypothetical protein ACJAVO_001179 [Parvibaculaceae bacterium]|jgi:hypothetical protein|tara:strand:- start:81 stop:284 length:204 start_codon:yes stop_codon:yes gene_type:complete